MSSPSLHFSSYTIHAPSWIIPQNIQENCVFMHDLSKKNSSFLAGIGLCFFETSACLQYTATDLPEDSSLFPYWHMHLPQDLPWYNPRNCAKICVQLVQKVAHLSPFAYVLHLPASATPQLLHTFLEEWNTAGYSNSLLCLENTKEHSLTALQSVILETECSICLDIGHALAFNQHQQLLQSPLLANTRLVHIHAPGATETNTLNPQRSDPHLPLTALSTPQKEIARNLLQAIHQIAPVPATPALATPILVEVFSLDGFLDSLPVLQELLPSLTPQKGLL